MGSIPGRAQKERGPRFEVCGPAQLVIDYLSSYKSQELVQISDLTLEKVATFNSLTGDQPAAFEDVDGTVYNIAYRSIAADADIGDKTGSLGRYVDSKDCAGIGVPTLFCSAMYAVVGSEEFLSASYSSGLNTSPSSLSFDLNDFVVTQNSSRWLQFLSVGSGHNSFTWIFYPLRTNHSTVGDSCVAGGGAEPCTTGTGGLGEIQQIQSQ
jgi:hypothetical protein